MKIQSLDELAAHLTREKRRGRKVVLCHGVFDLLHPGHIQHFQEARQLGDILVVTVTADAHVNKGPGRPAFTHKLRMESLAALACVDFVALSEWPTAVEVISRLRPDFYVKGSEYEDSDRDVTGKILDEAEAVRAGGGSVHFSRGEVFSSSSLINRHFGTLGDTVHAYIEDFRARHSSDEVIGAIRSLADLRVLVVGDVIIDQYCYCTALSKSPREVVVAARYLHEEDFAGGSLAVANHLAGLCREVTLVSTLGTEATHETFARSRLRPNVDWKVVHTPHRPTVVKRRFLESTFLSKMFELQHLDDTPHSAETEESLEAVVAASLPGHDLVVVADFGHGLLTPRILALLADSPAFLAVNTQTNSANMGFNRITRYRRVDYACLHEFEVRISTGSQYDPLPGLATGLRRSLHASRCMVTRGPHGTLLVEADDSILETPSLTTTVVDRVGAGDTVFAVTAPLVRRQVHGEIVGFVGNCAGALAVHTVCNREPVDVASLCKFATRLLK